MDKETQKMLLKQQELMSTLLEKMMDMQIEHSKMQQQWLELFKPPTVAPKSTTLEEREALKEAESMWTELDMNEMLRNMIPDDEGEF